jgi:selenocysteine-specific translation elongation factor
MNEQDYTEISHLRVLLRLERERTDELERQMTLLTHTIKSVKSRVSFDLELDDEDYMPSRLSR